MFLFYVLSFFKKGGILFKGGRYSRGSEKRIEREIDESIPRAPLDLKSYFYSSV